ncbi:MAG: adenylate kinase, partial [Anaerolineales bacterium]|nr:adenylate kinase [Anaerolineales bacterium]
EKFNPPVKAGICDVDGSELYQRDDDKVETVTKRIHVYFEQTIPLVEYYRKQGKLREINGMAAVEQVTEELLSALKK